MRILLRILQYGLLTLLAVVVTAAALFGYFVYSPTPEVPTLSGSFTHGNIDAGGLKRGYRLYVPRGLPKHAPLVVVMHGSGEDGAQIRVETGYRFDQLADEDGFVVVYPDAYSFDWNDCSVVGDFTANGHDVDDVGFLVALADQLIAENDLDRDRIFATGVSAGGFMSIRLALEAPSRFRAVAAVSANVPAPGNFKCRPTGRGASVLLMNGTNDPLVPFDGGEVSLLGLFYKGGNVLSSRDSARYFTELDKIAEPPTVTRTREADGTGTERWRWQNSSGREVELIAIEGGGHGIPQAIYRRPRLLGPSPTAPDGPALIWSFFARQR